MLILLASEFSIFGKLIKASPKTVQQQNLFLEKQLRFLGMGVQPGQKSFPSNVNFYIQQLCELIIPYESVFIDKT